MITLPPAFRSAYCIAALAWALGAPSASAEIRISHAQGEAVLAAAPQRVAVFDIAALDTLNALGIEAVAGVPKPADRPGSFAGSLSVYNETRYAPVGTLFEPDVEAVKALNPDLIIVGGRSRNAFEAMSALAPTLDLSAAGDPAETTIRNLEILGEAFGVQERAKSLVAALEADLAAVRESGGKAGKALLIFSAGENFSAQPPGSRFGGVYDLFGLDSVMAPAEPASGPAPERGSPEAEAARARQQALTEAAFAADPDWIFAIDRNAAVGGGDSTLPQRLSEDARVTGTKAWKEGRVIYLDPYAWYIMGGAGAGSLERTLKTVGAAFDAAR